VSLADAKRAAIELLEAEYRDMETRFRSLTPGQLERPVFTGEGTGWRVRDLIAHFAFWQTISARTAEKIAAEGTTPEDGKVLTFLGITPGLDARNDENFVAWRDRPIADALEHLHACHARLIRAIGALPADRVVKSEAAEDWYRYFWQPGVNHLRQHRVHIDAALKETATT
jgi:mycothiol maleylpyruvate isomerase-like protein